MELQRVANAGVLLKMDGTSILMDGLCGKVGPYLETPSSVFESLLENPPDVLCFTHWHADHFSEPLVAAFQKNSLRPVFGPEKLPYATNFRSERIGSVVITPVASRHLGKVDKDLNHVSYVIEGSQCVWFLGDAAPTQWRNREELPKPDVIIVPFAYATTEAAWKLTGSLTDCVVLVHMPPETEDPDGLWPLVKSVTSAAGGPKLLIPAMGQKIGI